MDAEGGVSWSILNPHLALGQALYSDLGGGTMDQLMPKFSRVATRVLYLGLHGLSGLA